MKTITLSSFAYSKDRLIQSVESAAGAEILVLADCLATLQEINKLACGMDYVIHYEKQPDGTYLAALKKIIK
ncbi:MAG: hypothetical protein ACOYJB_05190 [Christensenellaceae bacterium]|jgi:hypothetical protein